MAWAAIGRTDICYICHVRDDRTGATTTVSVPHGCAADAEQGWRT